MALPAIYEPGTMTPSVQDDGTPSHKTTLTTSPLLSLPREIRDYICARLLRAGDLTILRASKQLNHEAAERLHREGVCRISIGFPYDSGVDFVFPQKWKNIQNFQFRVFYGYGSTLAYRPVLLQLERFADLTETDLKRECLITIELSTVDSRPPIRLQAFRMTHILEGIACLTTFKTVVVMLVPNQYGVLRNIAEPADEKTMADIWSMIRGKLLPELGPAKLVGDADGEGQRLIFHPQEFRNSLART